MSVLPNRWWLWPTWLFGRPDVAVDFECEGGWLFVAVSNHGSLPAHDVSVGFDSAFKGADVEQAVPERALFSELGFLPPGKTIRTFVDSIDAYHARGEPTTIATDVSYRDRRGRPFSNEASHDLSIYGDLVWAEPAGGPGRDRSAEHTRTDVESTSER